MGLPTITVIGNLKRIETKVTATGKTVTKFQVECADKNKDGSWNNLYLSGECWEQTAMFVNQYFKEGSPAVVTGKLYTNIYEKQDGTKVYENKLLFPNVSFIPKDKSTSQVQVVHETIPAQQPQQPAQQYQPTQQPQQPQAPVQHEQPSLDMNIPF